MYPGLDFRSPHCIAKVGFELILLPPLPPVYLFHEVSGKQAHGFVHAEEDLQQLSCILSPRIGFWLINASRCFLVCVSGPDCSLHRSLPVRKFLEAHSLQDPVLAAIDGGTSSPNAHKSS